MTDQPAAPTPPIGKPRLGMMLGGIISSFRDGLPKECASNLVGIIEMMEDAEDKIEQLERELATAESRLREAQKAMQAAADQLKRGEWNSHISGTWTLLDDAIKSAREGEKG